MKNVHQILLSGPEQFPEIKKTIQVSNTPEPLIDEATHCTVVIVQANKNNSNTVYIGPETVSEDSFALEPGNSLTVNICNASKIYVYGTAGDKLAAPYTKFDT
jgi:hypothetical protein